MLFICYPKCTTCQKAKKFLEDKNLKFEIRNIKENNPSKEELTKWYHQSNLELKKFFNTSGLLYKELNLKEKLKELDEDEKLSLLATNGMLVKRPILITKDQVLVGFKAEEWGKIC